MTLSADGDETRKDLAKFESVPELFMNKQRQGGTKQRRELSRYYLGMPSNIDAETSRTADTDILQNRKDGFETS